MKSKKTKVPMTFKSSIRSAKNVKPGDVVYANNVEHYLARMTVISVDRGVAQCRCENGLVCAIFAKFLVKVTPQRTRLVKKALAAYERCVDLLRASDNAWSEYARLARKAVEGVDVNSSNNLAA